MRAGLSECCARTRAMCPGLASSTPAVRRYAHAAWLTASPLAEPLSRPVGREPHVSRPLARAIPGLDCVTTNDANSRCRPIADGRDGSTDGRVELAHACSGDRNGSPAAAMPDHAERSPRSSHPLCAALVIAALMLRLNSRVRPADRLERRGRPARLDPHGVHDRAKLLGAVRDSRRTLTAQRFDGFVILHGTDTMASVQAE